MYTKSQVYGLNSKLTFQVRLNNASVAVQKNLKEFSLKKQGKALTFRAESDEDCTAWIDSIQQCITQLSGVDGQFSEDEEDNADVISDVICKGIYCHANLESVWTL